MIVDELIQVAALARDGMDSASRHKIKRFIRSKWNRDGGVQGRSRHSDLYYTVFAAICMKAMQGRMPLLRLWKYVRSFGEGSTLDIVHLFCLIRLRSIFPISDEMRLRLLAQLEEKQAESSSDMFFKVVMAEYLNKNDRPETEMSISNADTTSDLAAAAVINHHPDRQAEAYLLDRYCESGGFCEKPDGMVPDLFSTATALFALHVLEVDLGAIRRPCQEFVQSVQKEDGGYACRVTDRMSDTECTWYALLSIGCLSQ